jgi:uncharacterized membrane protein YfhO
MYMLPLFLIAFGHMIKKEKVIPYIITLSLMILFQFYLGYMLALFIIFGFSAYIIFSVEKKQRQKSIIIFIVSTLIAVLITAPVWLSAFEQFLSSARGVSVISSLKSSKLFTNFATTLPMILSTGMIIYGLKMFLSQRLKSDKRLKPLYIMMILFMISLYIEPINKMWHTGSYQAFPVRYGHMLVLTGLAIFAAAVGKVKSDGDEPMKSDRRILVISTAAVGGYFFFTLYHIQNSTEKLKSYATTLWGSFDSLVIVFSAAVCFFAVAAVITGYYKKGFLKRSAFSVLICLLVLGEGYFNSSVYMGLAARTTDRFSAAVDLSDRISDDGVYRVKTESKLFDVNLVGAMGYNSLSHYTSLNCESYMFAMKKLGYSSYWMEVGSHGSTAFTDALMGNKYTIDSTPFYSKNDNIIYKNSSFAIFENSLSISLGTVITAEQAAELENIPEKDRADFQEKLFSALSDSDETLLTRYEPTAVSDGEISHAGDTYFYYRDDVKTGEITYNIEVSGRQKLYFDCFKYISARLTEPTNGSFDVYVNGNRLINGYPTKAENGFLFLGDFENENVTVTLEINKSASAYSFGVFGMDMELLEKEISNIRQATVNVDGDEISVNANCDGENDYLMLMIPQNRGFCISVNGKSVEALTVLDAFMAIPLEKGDNIVVLSYTPYGFKLSMVFFVIGLAFMAAFSALLSRSSVWYSEAAEKIVTAVFLTGAGLVFVLIYVFPMVVWLLGILKK